MQREQVRIGFQSLFSWLLSGSLISPTGKVSFFEWQLCEGPSKGHTTEKMERGKKWSTRQNSNPLPLDWQACGQPLCFNCSSMITTRRDGDGDDLQEVRHFRNKRAAAATTSSLTTFRRSTTGWRNFSRVTSTSKQIVTVMAGWVISAIFTTGWDAAAGFRKVRLRSYESSEIIS